MPTGGRRFIGAPCVSPQGVSEHQCVLSYDDRYFDVCMYLCFDLHVEWGHRGRLIDVTSLGVSVIDWHWRMEGWEELRCSCTEQQEDNMEGKKLEDICSESWFAFM